MISVFSIHPFAVHFPVALLTIGFLVDLFSLVSRKDKCLPRMGYYLEVIGMISVIIAWGSGHFFPLPDPMPLDAWVISVIHGQFATATLVLAILATIFRMVLVYLKKENTWLRYIFMVLSLSVFILVIFTARLGEKMVYDFMINP